jgi:hypothetical protein
MVPSQPGQIVCETLSQKTQLQKRAGGVAQGVGRVQTLVPQKKSNQKENERTSDYDKIYNICFLLF